MKTFKELEELGYVIEARLTEIVQYFKIDYPNINDLNPKGPLVETYDDDSVKEYLILKGDDILADNLDIDEVRDYLINNLGMDPNEMLSQNARDWEEHQKLPREERFFSFTQRLDYSIPKGLTNRERYTLKKFSAKLPDSVELAFGIVYNPKTNDFSFETRFDDEDFEIESETFGFGFDTISQAIEEAEETAKDEEGTPFSDNSLEFTFSDIAEEPAYPSIDEIYAELSFSNQQELADLMSDIESDPEDIDHSDIVSRLAGIENFGEMLDTFQLEQAITFLDEKLKIAQEPYEYGVGAKDTEDFGNLTYYDSLEEAIENAEFEKDELVFALYKESGDVWRTFDSELTDHVQF